MVVCVGIGIFDKNIFNMVTFIRIIVLYFEHSRRLLTQPHEAPYKVAMGVVNPPVVTLYALIAASQP